MRVTLFECRQRSLRWGLLLPADMDGVPGLSFDGIPAGGTYVYRSDANGDAGSWTPLVQNTDSNRLNVSLLSYPNNTFGVTGNAHMPKADPFDANSRKKPQSPAPVSKLPASMVINHASESCLSTGVSDAPVQST